MVYLYIGIPTEGKRAFHTIGVAILFTASVAYFSMASDLGSTAVYVEFVRYKSDLFVSAARLIDAQTYLKCTIPYRLIQQSTRTLDRYGTCDTLTGQ